MSIQISGNIDDTLMWALVVALSLVILVKGIDVYLRWKAAP